MAVILQRELRVVLIRAMVVRRTFGKEWLKVGSVSRLEDPLRRISLTEGSVRLLERGLGGRSRLFGLATGGPGKISGEAHVASCVPDPERRDPNARERSDHLHLGAVPPEPCPPSNQPAPDRVHLAATLSLRSFLVGPTRAPPWARSAPKHPRASRCRPARPDQRRLLPHRQR